MSRRSWGPSGTDLWDGDRSIEHLKHISKQLGRAKVKDDAVRIPGQNDCMGHLLNKHEHSLGGFSFISHPSATHQATIIGHLRAILAHRPSS